MTLQKTSSKPVSEFLRADPKNSGGEPITFDKTAEILGIPGHLLHLWTKKFPQIKTETVNGIEVFSGRNVKILQGVKRLLVEKSEDYKNVQKILNDKGEDYMIAIGKYAEAPKEILSRKPGGALSSFSGLKAENRLSAAISPPEEKKSGFKKFSLFSKPDNAGTTAPSRANSADHAPVLTALQNMGNGAEYGDYFQNAPAEEITEVTPGSFEENWSSFMRETGRADPPSATDVDFADDFEDDIPVLYTDAEPMKKNAHKPHQPSAQQTNDDISHRPAIVTKIQKIGNAMPAPGYTEASGASLTPENQEILRHALAKLNIIKGELKITAGVLNGTLKAFGYAPASAE